MNLSRYFTLVELIHSNTAKAEGIDNRPGAREIESLRALCTAVLDPLRALGGHPVKVNSGYRGPALNQRIKGAKNSQHLTGQAADIQSPGVAVLELFKMVIRSRLPFDQIIYEVKGASKWVHVSHNPGANRGEILLARFGANGKVMYPRITAQQALEMTEPVTRGMDLAGEPGYEETADEPEPEAPMARGLREAAPARTRTRSPKAPGAMKGPARKARAPKKAAPRRSATKKTAARKTAARKSTARNATVRKSAAKKGAGGKARPMKTTRKKAPSATKRTTKAAEKRSAPARKAATRATVKRRAAAKPGKRPVASRARRR
jgi:zinc D-Ala-D-Ala carboxypeptidase